MTAYDLLPCTHRQHISNKNCYFAHERLALEARIIRGLIAGLEVLNSKS